MDIPMQDLFRALGSRSEAEQKRTAMEMLAKLDPQQTQQVQSILRDEQKLQSILAAPEAQQLLRRLKGNQHG